MQQATAVRVAGKGISLDLTLDCGQSFRWKRLQNGHWQGIVDGSRVTVWLENGDLCCDQMTEQQLRHYFDLDTDYEQIHQMLAQFPVLERAGHYARGIRILRQNSFEALITFILSQQNNIPRITGLVSRLCEQFGTPIGADDYAFPTLEQLAACTVDDLAPLRSGYRAKYLVDAAQKINSGAVSLDFVTTASIQEARTELLKINGVGIKVAECALLFGFHRLEAFPIDVWIGRALEAFFPEGFPPELDAVGGIVQQYLFHYIRTSPETAHLRKR